MFQELRLEAKLWATEETDSWATRNPGTHVSRRRNKQREGPAVETPSLEELEPRRADPTPDKPKGRLSPDTGQGWDSWGAACCFQ